MSDSYKIKFIESYFMKKRVLLERLSNLSLPSFVAYISKEFQLNNHGCFKVHVLRAYKSNNLGFLFEEYKE